MKQFLVILIIAVLAGIGGWFFGRRSESNPTHNASNPTERKVEFYQSSMHPWIKSDKPGNCTICGMKLTPVYEGQNGAPVDTDVVTLSANSVTVVDVRTTPVSRGTLTRTIKAPGVVSNDETSRRALSAYVDGRVDELFVNYAGAIVKQGELLARIYSPSLLTAEREYLSLATDVQQGATNAATADHNRLLEAAEQRLRRLGLQEAQISALTNKSAATNLTDILAPISGTVLERFVVEGQYVKAGDRLFELADFSRVWLQFEVYEQDLPWVRVGVPAEITTSARPGEVYSAKVAFIDPTLNPATRTARARVELTNNIVKGPDGALRYELPTQLFVEAAFSATATNVLLAPRTAIVSPGSEPVVYVDLGDGNYQQRPVKLGRRGDEAWEVLDGLEEGDLVVTSGNMLLDAQAQLNRNSAAPADHKHQLPVPAEHPPEHEAVGTPQLPHGMDPLIAAASQLSVALAADNLDAFNKALPAASIAAAHVAEQVTNSPALPKVATALGRPGAFTPAKTLANAREQFVPFSNALVELLRAVPRDSDLQEHKLYLCPMVDQGVEGAPKRSYWVQIEGPLRNPFFGKQMLTCGSEVKP